MANWETLEELMNKPLPPVARDPFFHTQQFPKFMKRRTVLEKDNSIKSKLQEEEKSSNIRKFRDGFIVKNRLKTGWNSIEVDKSFGQLDDHDKAKDKQRLFTSISPKDKEFLGEYKYSVCPSTGFRSQSVRSKKKKEKLEECKERVKARNRDAEFIGILKKNVVALLSGKFIKKCAECGLEKCECKSGEEEKLILKVFHNLSKGKVLLDEIKEKKKINSLRQSSIKKKLNGRKMKISIDSGLMRYNLTSFKNKGNNLPQISTFNDRSRRHSS